MKVAVIGAGPVGMVGVHAALQNGAVPVIYGIAEKSRIRGVQYLHESIPGLTEDKPEAKVQYIKVGTREGYAEKIYGDPNVECSWDQWEGSYPAWCMEDLYDRLWDEHSGLIYDTEVRFPLLEALLEEYDFVFSSINPLGYCQDTEAHQFNWQQVYVSNQISYTEPGTILYNGDPETLWYRTSNIFGDEKTEFPNGRDKIERELIPFIVRKPLSTTCDCLLGNERFIRIGRYGEFRKNLLVHHAYHRVCEVLEDAM
jgi:hypothetical protein